MNDQTASSAPEDRTATEQATSVAAKTVIRPNMSNYVPDKSGNGKRTHRTDDFVARTLAGKSVEDVRNFAGQLGIDHSKWSHLNPGQQRMLIGNRLRTLMKQKDEPLTEEAITAVFGEPVAPYDADAAAAAKAEREAAAAQKKAEKEAKAAAKPSSDGAAADDGVVPAGSNEAGVQEPSEPGTDEQAAEATTNRRPRKRS